MVLELFVSDASRFSAVSMRKKCLLFSLASKVFEF